MNFLPAATIAAFLLQPLTLPSNVTLLIDPGVTVFASRNPADNQVGTISSTQQQCGLRQGHSAGVEKSILTATIDHAVAHDAVVCSVVRPQGGLASIGAGGSGILKVIFGAAPAVNPAAAYDTITYGPGAVSTSLKKNLDTGVTDTGIVSKPIEAPFTCTTASFPTVIGELFLFQLDRNQP